MARATALSQQPARARSRLTLRLKTQLRLLPRNIALALIALWVLGPFSWTVSTSLKGIRELYTQSLSLIPHNPTLANYQYMFLYLEDIPIYFHNSVLVTGIAVLLTVALSALMGYAFARMQFRGRDLIFYSLIVAMFVPHAGGLVAAYELMYALNLRNNLLGLALYFAANLSIPLFIMRQTFLSLPRELEESAMIDGAGRFTIFTRIALPFGYGGMIVIAILTFVHVWGDYLFTITMIDLQSLYTVGVGISMFYGGGAMVQDADISGPGIQTAGYLAAAFPVMVTYLLLQRYFVRGLTEGVLKM
jgi:ABC-type glycerol-3-phosphate transport system permease component